MIIQPVRQRRLLSFYLKLVMKSNERKAKLFDTFQAAFPSNQECEHCGNENQESKQRMWYKLFLPATGKTLHFCKSACLRGFVDELTYLDEVKQEAAVTPERTTVKVTRGL